MTFLNQKDENQKEKLDQVFNHKNKKVKYLKGNKKKI